MLFVHRDKSLTVAEEETEGMYVSRGYCALFEGAGSLSVETRPLAVENLRVVSDCDKQGSLTYTFDFCFFRRQMNIEGKDRTVLFFPNIYIVSLCLQLKDSGIFTSKAAGKPASRNNKGPLVGINPRLLLEAQCFVHREECSTNGMMKHGMLTDIESGFL